MSENGEYLPMHFLPEKPDGMKADCLISVGPNCRPAGQLKKNNMKRSRFPLDWMVFSADALVHCIDTSFSDFFLEYKKDPFDGEQPQRCHFARDINNDIRIIHHLPITIPFDEAVRDFQRLVRENWNTFCTRMADVKSVILFGSYSDPEDAQKILRAFQIRFPNTLFRIVNISHRENCPEDEIGYIKVNDSFDQYYMCDQFEPDFWLGNMSGWKAVLSLYSEIGSSEEPSDPNNASDA